ncbi:hypothetical protein [Streptomyces cucumeris]|uniref:hypothetical protein n=1 Tax=Streptomyces cucumeris TaxID=2962890 RepID=UPI0020C8C0F2|nr:hypothetical protein [Streptomyces sp. NEAU-Y11]MCP9209535.1 hypothetical protein [Streptomyces sp. NEAU-Y11]
MGHKWIPDLEDLAKRYNAGEGESLGLLAREAGVRPTLLRTRLIEAGYITSSKGAQQERRDRGVCWVPVERIAKEILDKQVPVEVAISYFQVEGITLDEDVIADVIRRAKRLRSLAQREERSQMRRPSGKQTLLTPEKLSELAIRHAEGKGPSVEALAEVTGVSASALKAKLRSAGYVTATRATWINRQVRLLTGQMVRMYQDEAQDIPAIMRYLARHDVHITPDRVRRTLKEQGVTMRPELPPHPIRMKRHSPAKVQVVKRGRPKSRHQQLAEDRGSELARRILEGGETIRDIAKELKVDHIQLSAALKRSGHLPNMNLQRYRARMRTQRASTEG